MNEFDFSISVDIAKAGGAAITYDFTCICDSGSSAAYVSGEDVQLPPGSSPTDGYAWLLSADGKKLLVDSRPQADSHTVSWEFCLDVRQGETFTVDMRDILGLDGLDFTVRENGVVIDKAVFEVTKAGRHTYTITASDGVDVHADDWADLKTKGPDGSYGHFGAITEAGQSHTDEVGVEDKVDYLEFTLETAARLTFDLASVNAASFSINVLQDKVTKGTHTYSLKSLQKTAIKAGQEVSSKALMLEAGTYYIEFASTDKKSADAAYSIVVGDGTFFYTQGDDGSNNWLYDTKTKAVNDSENFRETSLDEDTRLIVMDMDAPEDGTSGWVGYGDATDYARITLENAGNLSFDLASSDAATFEICQLIETEKKGVVTTSVKKHQSTKVTLAKGATAGRATTKALQLEAGEYYIAMTSTTASKGGAASYSVSLNDASFFYTKGDDGANNWLYDSKTKIVNDPYNFRETSLDEDTDIVEMDEVLFEDDSSGWVGYGDVTDYARITLDNAAKVAFELSASDAVTFDICQLTETEKKGVVTTSVKKLQSTKVALAKGATEGRATTKGLLLEAGEYYIAMTSTNAAKGGSADYSVRVKSMELFDNEWNDEENNSFAEAKELGTFTLDELSERNEYVGFGDSTDWFCLDITESGIYDIGLLEENAGAAKMTLYSVGAKDKLTAVKYDKKLGGYNLMADGEYALMIASQDKGKGGKNTDYQIALF